MYLGVDYYPEHWDFVSIDTDLQRMKDMGVNIIRIGEFAWHMMEREEGLFDFDFFDKVIVKAKEYDIKVMFGTPTATFPAWLGHKYPSIYLSDENGQKMSFGGRRQYCYNSSKYNELSLRIVEKLITHYKDEKQIISWQIDNELGHEGSDMCFCDECHHQFQQYLKEKYGTIHDLNHRWGTIFWGQSYNHFAEIPLPFKTITVHNPSMLLEWARFRSLSLGKFALRHIELVKKLKGKHQTVTTNLPGGFFEKWFDHNEFSRELDFVSYDNYPVWGGLAEPVTPAELSMSLDFVRGLKKENFWITEQLMGAQGHDIIGYLPRPGQAIAWSYHAFAHGCNNMIYFRWRGMNRGAEQNCLGIIDANNRISRKYYEVQKFFSEIRHYKDIIDSPIQAETAVLYDFDNIWSWRSQRENPAIDFSTEAVRLYEPFYQLNTAIDVIRYDHDFSGYKVLLVPILKLADETLAKRLEEFVAGGGTVVISYRAGVKDKDNNIRFGEMIPGPLAELLGIEVEESESLHAGRSAKIIDNEGNRSTCTIWRDMVRPTTATVLNQYEDSFYSKYACVTENHYGKGKAYYIGGGIEETVLDLLSQKIANEVNLTIYESDKGIEVVERIVNHKKYLMVINHLETEGTYSGFSIAPYGHALYLVEEDGTIHPSDLSEAVN